MKVSRFMAQQYANPSGIFGRLLTGLLLNRANSRSNQLAFDLLDIKSDSSVLELGFGGGDLLFKIARRTNCQLIHGLESSKVMLQRAQKKAFHQKSSGTIRLHQGQVENLPYENNQFNRLCTVNTVYFWQNLAVGLSEIARVTRVGGIFVIGFGSNTALTEAGYADNGFKLYPPEQIRKAITDNGFDIKQERRIERSKRGTFYVIQSIRNTKDS